MPEVLRNRFVRGLLLVLLLATCSALPPRAFAQAPAPAPTGTPAPAQAPAPAATPAPTTAPGVTAAPGSVGVLPGVRITRQDGDYALPIQMLILMTVLALAPSFVILMTSFTRLVIVFGILRSAIGLQSSPPNQIIIGLSLFLTVFIMHPVIEQVNGQALKPYLAGQITQDAALDKASVPMKGFMLKQTREKDLLLFMDMAGSRGYRTPGEVPLYVLVPAFVISELRIAFQIGFMLFLPFLVVDLVVASVLMSLGMMMLPPVMISLPIKLLLFVLADGWYLIVESVVRGYSGA